MPLRVPCLVHELKTVAVKIGDVGDGDVDVVDHLASFQVSIARFVETCATVLHVTLAGLRMNDSHAGQDMLRSRPVQDHDGLSLLHAHPSEDLRRATRRLREKAARRRFYVQAGSQPGVRRRPMPRALPSQKALSSRRLCLSADVRCKLDRHERDYRPKPNASRTDER